MSKGMHYKVVDARFDNQPSIVSAPFPSQPQVNQVADVGLPAPNAEKYTELSRSTKVTETEVIREQPVETTDLLTDFDKITIEIVAGAVENGLPQMLFVWVPRRVGQLHCKKTNHCVVVKAGSTDAPEKTTLNLKTGTKQDNNMSEHLDEFKKRAVHAALEKNGELVPTEVKALIDAHSDFSVGDHAVIEKLVWSKMSNTSADYVIGLNIYDGTNNNSGANEKLTRVEFLGIDGKKHVFNQVLDPKLSGVVTSTHYDPDGSFIRASRVSETDPFLSNSHGEIPKYESKQDVTFVKLHDLHVLWGMANLGTLLEIYNEKNEGKQEGMRKVEEVISQIKQLDESPDTRRTLGKRIGDIIDIATQLGGSKTTNTAKYWLLSKDNHDHFVYPMPTTFYNILRKEFESLFMSMSSFNTSSTLTIEAIKLPVDPPGEQPEDSPASAVLHLMITAYYPRFARMYLPLDYSTRKGKQ